MRPHQFRRAVGASILVLAVAGVAPTQAATKKTVKRKPAKTVKTVKPAARAATTTAVTTTSTSTTVVVTTTAAPAAPTTLAIAAPPTTVNYEAEFTRLFAPRDAWSFAKSASLDADVNDLLADLKFATDGAFVAGAGRFMVRNGSNQASAISLTFVADPAKMSPAALAAAVSEGKSDFVDPQPLVVSGGSAFVGREAGTNLYVGLVAFDRYYSEVYGASRQAVIDAEWVMATNMGISLTL